MKTYRQNIEQKELEMNAWTCMNNDLLEVFRYNTLLDAEVQYHRIYFLKKN